MPVFEYRGINKAGKNVRGTLDVENARAARAKLKKDGIFVVDLKNKKTEKKKGARAARAQQKVSIGELSTMTRQLATLIKANIPLVEALSAVAEQTENEYLRDVMADVKNMVNEGSPLYRAFSKYPKIFDKIYASMSEAGETSGTLDIILLRLAEFSEAQSELNSRVKSALTYPIIMLVVTFGLLTFLFIKVVPQIAVIFEENGQELPALTQVVMGVSGFFIDYWIAVGIAVIGGVVLFQGWRATESGAATWDAILLKIPIVGRLALMIATSRFTRTLATLLNGGVPMLNAMDIVRNVVGNHVLAVAIDQGRANISEGESIAGPLKKSGQFPPLVIHMINIGEKTGELEHMLNLVSDSYDFEVKTKIDGLTSVLNPILIVILGGVIAIIVFAILMPMFDMMDSIG